MRRFTLIITVLMVAGCSGGKSAKTPSAATSPILFNGFLMGTPLDTLARRIPAKPSQKLEDELDYLGVTVDGVRWDSVAYRFVGGKLARATAIQVRGDAVSYQKLLQAFTVQYGKPTQNIDSMTIWSRRDAELSLQPGIILFSRR